MMRHAIATTQNGSNPTRRAMLLAALLLALPVVPASADTILFENGQALQGIIQDQNDYYVNINVRGTRMPVPRTRIREVRVNTLEENLQALLNQADEAIQREDISVARALMEQARGLKADSSSLAQRFGEIDTLLTDLERRGGTPAERMRRAQQLLEQATRAYDRIRMEEGNELLIQALRTDPTYQPAHVTINRLLTENNRPDLMLAATYFSEVMWPDNVQADSPVIGLLPEVYAELAARFGETTDMARADQYYELMNLLAQAFILHPEWKQTVTDEALRQQIDRPVAELLTDMVRENLTRREYDLALEKLAIFSQPGNPETDPLAARAYVGLGQLDKALEVVERSQQSGSQSANSQAQVNAIRRLMEAEAALKQGETEQATRQLEEVFYGTEQLLPEVNEAVGRRLAELKVKTLETAEEPAAWLKAEVNALNIRFGFDPTRQMSAPAELKNNLATAPWRLEPTWMVNGRAINVPATLNDALRTSLAAPLGVQFDPASPFVLTLGIDLGMSEADGQKFVQAIESNNPADFDAPVAISGITLTAEASYPALGRLMTQTWTAQSALPADAPPLQIALPSIRAIETVVQTDLSRYIPPTLNPLASRLTVPQVQPTEAAPI